VRAAPLATGSGEPIAAAWS